ncbi:hypothetical protein EV421DRAFT_1740605 [Armillaria borealis]|uniref:Uncharacterized protein n=1 Tax=Armillaria borealis TaxID=47425 RepID=A0AA39MHX3_9AGAR|nr:hypothetical protein EV421DRAFT_1740605 [Armillaria borealis]
MTMTSWLLLMILVNQLLGTRLYSTQYDITNGLWFLRSFGRVRCSCNEMDEGEDEWVREYNDMRKANTICGATRCGDGMTVKYEVIYPSATFKTWIRMNDWCAGLAGVGTKATRYYSRISEGTLFVFFFLYSWIPIIPPDIVMLSHLHYAQSSDPLRDSANGVKGWNSAWMTEDAIS